MKSIPWASSLFAGLDVSSARLIATKDLDEMRQVTSSLFSEHKIHLLDKHTPLNGVIDHYPIGPFSLNRLCWSTPVFVDPGRLDNYYLITIPLTGHCTYNLRQAEVSLSPGDLAVISPGDRFNFKADEHFDQYVLHLHKDNLDRMWRNLTGDDSEETLSFESLIANGSQTWKALSPILNNITSLLRGDYEFGQTSHFHSTLEEVLIYTLLINQPHSKNKTQPKIVVTKSNQQFGQAKEFLLENMEEQLTLSRISEALDVPPRTLQWVFNKEAGMGPMQWLREQRLYAIRKTLLTNSPESSPHNITSLALQYHFSHLGEFSQVYKRTFGETPSETKRRKK